MIGNIAVTHKEYRATNITDNTWVRTQDIHYWVSSKQIQNMIDSQSYFAQLGGKMYWSYKINKRFGLIPTKVVVVSFCGRIKKVLTFNYANAKEFEHVTK